MENQNVKRFCQSCGMPLQNEADYGSSTRRIVQAVTEIFDRVANPLLLVRRFSISANRLLRESDVPPLSAPEQLDLFTDYAAEDARRAMRAWYPTLKRWKQAQG